ncbi:hypothetical protein SDC9_157890 [bioreactor metagenome]|uniref:Uncharacterized protein n=1 Tax=bioreactor metagenome TaxID=1076179 RepID=A0A645F899_9ZZZZ
MASIGDIFDAFLAGKYTPTIIDANPTINEEIIPILGI